MFPGNYERILPCVLGNQPFWVRASGIAELGCAALLAGRRTAAFGGWATATLFVIVFPASAQMALDGGKVDLRDHLASPAANRRMP